MTKLWSFLSILSAANYLNDFFIRIISGDFSVLFIVSLDRIKVHNRAGPSLSSQYMPTLTRILFINFYSRSQRLGLDTYVGRYWNWHMSTPGMYSFLCKRTENSKKVFWSSDLFRKGHTFPGQTLQYTRVQNFSL
jgi:hypothetical protein